MATLTARVLPAVAAPANLGGARKAGGVRFITFLSIALKSAFVPIPLSSATSSQDPQPQPPKQFLDPPRVAKLVQQIKARGGKATRGKGQKSGTAIKAGWVAIKAGRVGFIAFLSIALQKRARPHTPFGPAVPRASASRWKQANGLTGRPTGTIIHLGQRNTKGARETQKVPKHKRCQPPLT